jgi:hypothetical protein
MRRVILQGGRLITKPTESEVIKELLQSAEIIYNAGSPINQGLEGL